MILEISQEINDQHKVLFQPLELANLPFLFVTFNLMVFYKHSFLHAFVFEAHQSLPFYRLYKYLWGSSLKPKYQTII